MSVLTSSVAPTLTLPQSVWVQDVPLRAKPIPNDSKATDFPAAFIRVLRGLNVAPALINLINNGVGLPVHLHTTIY